MYLLSGNLRSQLPEETNQNKMLSTHFACLQKEPLPLNHVTKTLDISIHTFINLVASIQPHLLFHWHKKQGGRAVESYVLYMHVYTIVYICFNNIEYLNHTYALIQCWFIECLNHQTYP